MNRVISTFALAAFAVTLTGCCGFDFCNWGCCDPCPKAPCCEKPCPEKKPRCCPKPHVWDDRCCDPANYAY